MLTKRSYAFAGFAICLAVSQPSLAEVNSETGARDFIVRQAEIDRAKEAGPEAADAGEDRSKAEARSAARPAAKPAKVAAVSTSPSAVERARAAFQRSMQNTVQIDPIGSRGAPVAPAAAVPVAAAPSAKPASVVATTPAVATPAGATGLQALVARHAAANGVPFALADAVVRIESRYNPRAANAGNFGLMQIRHQTARGMGYGGSAGGLLDAETNARFGMKYLAMAYRMAGGDTCRTIMKYQSGHMSERMSGANRAYCAKVRTIAARS